MAQSQYVGLTPRFACCRVASKLKTNPPSRYVCCLLKTITTPPADSQKHICQGACLRQSAAACAQLHEPAAQNVRCNCFPAACTKRHLARTTKARLLL